MTREVTLDPDAAVELEAAAIWYNDKRPGLGLQFLAAVDRAIQHAVRWPHTGTLVDDLPPDLTVRRLPVSRFPYHVAYMVDEDRLHILAVAHDRRRPGYWRQRSL